MFKIRRTNCKIMLKVLKKQLWRRFFQYFWHNFTILFIEIEQDFAFWDKIKEMFIKCWYVSKKILKCFCSPCERIGLNEYYCWLCSRLNGGKFRKWRIYTFDRLTTSTGPRSDLPQFSIYTGNLSSFPPSADVCEKYDYLD